MTKRGSDDIEFLDGLLASPSNRTPVHTDIPTLDNNIADAYPKAVDVHRRFWELANKFSHIYMCVLNFGSLMAEGKCNVDFINPYERCTKGKINTQKLNRDENKHCFNARCFIPGNIVNMCYKKNVYDHIHNDNFELAAEFKKTCAMLKIPDVTQLVVKCGNHYHMLIFSNKSIFSSNAYKNASSSTITRKVASSKRNGDAPGKLDVFQYLMYLCTSGKETLGWMGSESEEMTRLQIEIMKLAPKSTDVQIAFDDVYDDEAVMQKDGNNELAFMNVAKKAKTVMVTTDDITDLLNSCELPDLGVVRNSIANAAIENLNTRTEEKSFAKGQTAVEALVEAGCYNHSDLLQMASAVPYLMCLYKNPQQTYVTQIMQLARAHAVYKVGVNRIVYDLYHNSDFDPVLAHNIYCNLTKKHQLIMLSIAMKIMHFKSSDGRCNFIRISGTSNIGKTWFVMKGLNWLNPHHPSLTVNKNTAFEYKELCMPAFFACMDDFNTEFFKTEDVEIFKKVIGGQSISVQEKGVPSTPSLPMPILILSNFGGYRMHGVREPHVQREAIRTRAWFECELNERCIQLTDDQLQQTWLWLMFNLIGMKFPNGYSFTSDVIKQVFKRLIVD